MPGADLIPRLARILLNALTVLSLVLCVATVALWILTYRVGREANVSGRRGLVGGNSSAGGLAVYVGGHRADVTVVTRHRQVPADRPPRLPTR